MSKIPSPQEFTAATKEVANKMAALTLDHPKDWEWALYKRGWEVDAQEWADLVASAAEVLGQSIKEAASGLVEADKLIRAARRKPSDRYGL